MNIHEYQAKGLLAQYGIGVLPGYLIEDPVEAEAQARKIQSDVAVVKAQVHAGGRGKAGGVKLIRSLTEAIDTAKEMIGKRLYTHQTGAEGVLVRKVYIEEGCAIRQEYYLSLVLDRADSRVALIASAEGGMEIEETAENSPEKILTQKLDPAIGLAEFQIRAVISHLGVPAGAHTALAKTLKALYQCYIEKDCSMIEINPLVLTEDNQIIALDAKMGFDDNALYRHPEILALRDLGEEDPKEVEASKFDLSYISLDGSIACLVNGAGLAMATMDSIQYAGGKPANFLDVGGSATEENVTNAFRIILSDPKVKGIFVNIFGGIMQCDTIARGIIAATQRISLRLPLVVRLEGNREREGRELLEQSGLNIHTATGMEDGAALIVKLTQEGTKQ